MKEYGRTADCGDLSALDGSFLYHMYLQWVP